MINKTKAEKSITRRFNEVFLINLNELDQEDFEYFIKRIADFFEFIKENHPEFSEGISKKVALIDKQLRQENIKLDEYFKNIEPVVDQLEKNQEFLKILLTGKDQHIKYINQGAHSVSVEEGIYLSWDFNLKQLLSTEPPINITLDEAKKILIDLNRLLYELKSIEKTDFVTDFEKILKENQEALDLHSLAEKKTNRIFDYSRISSFRQIEDIWKYIYDDGQTFSSTSFKLHLAKESFRSSSRGDIFSASKVSRELKIDLQRFYNSILDWLDSQNFLEEALVNFRTWAELVNNDYFKDQAGMVDEEILKKEFSKYLFGSYNILAIREPDFNTKKPDYFLQIRDRRIIGEAKLIKPKATKSLTKPKVISAIRQGLKQIISYSKIFPYVEDFVLVVFNYDPKVELTSEIMVDLFQGKPLLILPINIMTRPSGSNYLSYTSDEIKKLIATF